MIDYFAIALTHGLLALAVWRLLQRDDLDSEGEAPAKPVKPWLKDRKGTREQPPKQPPEQAGADA